MDYDLVINPFLLSLKVVTCSAIIFALLGTLLAHLLSQKKLHFRWLIDAIVTLPLIFPPIAVGFFLLLLLGREGWLGKFFLEFDISFVFTFNGLVIAAVISGLPLMVKPLQSAIESFPKAIKEASYLSGKNELKTLLFITLPSIKHAFFASLLIATARSLGEVGITLMLGGNIVGKTDTISLAIYNAVFDGEHELALILSGILVVTSLIFFLSLHILGKKNEAKTFR